MWEVSYKTSPQALFPDLVQGQELGIWPSQLLKSSMSIYPIERISKGFSVKYLFFSGPCIHSSNCQSSLARKKNRWIERRDINLDFALLSTIYWLDLILDLILHLHHHNQDPIQYLNRKNVLIRKFSYIYHLC